MCSNLVRIEFELELSFWRASFPCLTALNWRTLGTCYLLHTPIAHCGCEFGVGICRFDVSCYSPTVFNFIYLFNRYLLLTQLFQLNLIESHQLFFSYSISPTLTDRFEAILGFSKFWKPILSWISSSNLSRYLATTFHSPLGHSSRLIWWIWLCFRETIVEFGGAFHIMEINLLIVVWDEILMHLISYLRSWYPLMLELFVPLGCSIIWLASQHLHPSLLCNLLCTWEVIYL